MFCQIVGTCTWFTQGLRMSSSVAARPRVPAVYGYSIVAEFKHSPEAFTQGLEFDQACSTPAGRGGVLCEDVYWESTGQEPRCNCNHSCNQMTSAILLRVLLLTTWCPNDTLAAILLRHSFIENSTWLQANDMFAVLWTLLQRKSL
jgi:hypothetical protein